MLCFPIRSPFNGSRRFPGGGQSARKSDVKCSIPNLRRAADSMLTKRATRSLWNNRSVSGQRNDRITLSEYYGLRKAYSFFLAPPGAPRTSIAGVVPVLLTLSIPVAPDSVLPHDGDMVTLETLR